MDLAWMGILTLLVLGEKIVPPRWRLRRVAGVLVLIWGAGLAASAWIGV